MVLPSPAKLLADFQTPLSERVPGPPWYVPAALGVGMCTTLIPSSMRLARIALAGPVMVGLLAQPPKIDTGDVAVNFTAATVLAAISLKWLDFGVQQDTEKEAYRVPEGNGRPRSNERIEELSADPQSGEFQSFWQRLRWSASLWFTSRGVSWNWKVNNVPAGVEPGYPRLQFVRQCFHRFVFCVLGADFAHSTMQSSPYGHLPNDQLNLYTDSVFMRTSMAWLTALEAYCHLQLPYYVFATLTTTTFLCRPEQWPPIMGNFFKDAWSVRQVWGKCWHQQARKSITAFCDPLTDLLRIPEKTLLSRYTKLYSAFFCTAAVHHLGAYTIGRNHGGMYTLWMSQAVVITLEDFVIWLGKRYGFEDNGIVRTVGKAWTVFWLSQICCLPTAAGVALNKGCARDPSPLGLADKFFPAALKYDAFWKTMLDRLGTYVLLKQALGVIVAENVEQITWAAGAGALAGAWSIWQRS